MNVGDYVCFLLVCGMVIVEDFGVNLYEFGLIGFSDMYIVVVMLDEEMYWGKFLIDGVGL